MRQIHSLCELPQEERQTIRSIAIRNGLFASFIGTTILYLLDFYPFTMGTGFSFAVSFLLSFNPPILLFVFGYAISESIKLAKLGYVRAAKPYEFPSTTNSSFKSPEFSLSQPSSIHSSMSINPASGLPMCGSSRLDCQGNPFGTNSW
jgi:hypothetical protein